MTAHSVCQNGATSFHFNFVTALLTLDWHLQLANKLNTAVKGQERGPLDIFVQVNTSGEESKFGVEPQDCVSLAEHVHKECDLLRFAGLMTIGQQDYTSRPEDFQVSLISVHTVLRKMPCRHAYQLYAAIGLDAYIACAQQSNDMALGAVHRHHDHAHAR